MRAFCILIICASAAVCLEARRQKDRQKDRLIVDDPSMFYNKLTDFPDDDDLDIPGEFDDETETVITMIDMSEELMKNSTEFVEFNATDLIDGGLFDLIDKEEIEEEEEEEMVMPGKRRRHRKKGQRNPNTVVPKIISGKSTKLVKKMLKKVSLENSRRCDKTEARIERLCETVNSGKYKSLMDKVLKDWLKDSNQKTAWRTCCSLENDEAKMKCFEDSRMGKVNETCSLGGGQKFDSCCNVTLEARLMCFDRYKESSCNSNSTSFKDVTLTEVSKSVWVPKKSRHGRLNKGKGRMAAAMKEKKMALLCCDAGTSDRMERDLDRPSEDVCELHYATWAPDQEIENQKLCSSKFIWCCMNEVDNDKRNRKGGKMQGKRLQKIKNKRRQNRKDKKAKKMNIDSSEMIPDETGQTIEEHMNETEYTLTFVNPEKECCSAGGNFTLRMNEQPDDDVCDLGSMMFKDEWPQVNQKCINWFKKCCMKPEKIEMVADIDGDEEKIDKKARDYDLYRGREMPDGMRRSPSGHYYYVDYKRPPGYATRPEAEN